MAGTATGLGERNDDENSGSTSTLVLDKTPLDPKSKANWARLIRKVYEVDSLECPQCSHAMRIIAIIDEAALIRKILKHLYRWGPIPEQPEHPARDPFSQPIPLSSSPIILSRILLPKGI